jgi:beta-galactosidase
MLMESCPDAPQWKHPVQLKRPKLHQAEMLQALGHGAEGTCYFQWRKGRGGGEKLHGAVVDHVGHSHTRVFKSVAELSQNYEKLAEIIGSETRSQVALVYDWDVRWAFEASEGVRSQHEAYLTTCLEHYGALARQGVAVDVVSTNTDLSRYELVVAPQLWMLAPGVAERIARFVQAGGSFVATYYTGYCDQSNRCFTGGFPGDGLMRVLGIWNEETDWLPNGAVRRVEACPEAAVLKLAPSYTAERLCALVQLQGAQALLSYAEDFYAGTPALTRHGYGKGTAYYQAAALDGASLRDFYAGLIDQRGLSRVLGRELPAQLAVQRRLSATREYLFFQNFSPEERTVPLAHADYFDLLQQQGVAGALRLGGWDSTVLRREL